MPKTIEATGNVNIKDITELKPPDKNVSNNHSGKDN
jgi:hypothetical protein